MNKNEMEIALLVEASSDIRSDTALPYKQAVSASTKVAPIRELP